MHRRHLIVRSSLVGLIAGVAAVGAFPSQVGAVGSGHIAGYVAPPSANPTQSAAVSVVVPTFNCKSVPAGGFQAVAAGARLANGSGNTGGGILLVCGGPVVDYVPFMQINGSSIGTGITVNPGDMVTASVSEGPTGSTVTLTDGAQTQTASGPGASITEDDIGNIAGNCSGTAACSPVPKSKAFSFSNASIDGLNLVAAGGVAQNLVDAAGAPEITSGKATKKSGFGAFKTKWVFSCGTGGVC